MSNKLRDVRFFRRARYTHSIPFRSTDLQDLEDAARAALDHMPPGSEVGWDYAGLDLDEVRPGAMAVAQFLAKANPRMVLELLAELRDAHARLDELGAAISVPPPSPSE